LTLLDRYLFKSVLFTCLAAMGLFGFVLALGNAVKDLVPIANQVSIDVLVKLVLLLIPFVISYALPMGMLTGVLLSLGRLSADHEVTAMRAAGLSLGRIARPLFFLAALGAALGLYVNFEAMPWARVEYHHVIAAALRSNPISFIKPRTFIRDFPGHVVYVGEQEGDLLRDIWVWELDKQQRVTRLIRADAGRLYYDEATNSLVPTLIHAKSEERDHDNPEDFSRSPKAPSVGKAEEIRFPLDQFFSPGRVNVKTDWLTYAELRARQAKLAAQVPAAGKEQELARERMKTAMVLHDKANLALAVLTFVLVGVPLGVKVSRRETSANLGVALVLVLGYYLLSVMVKWLDRHPEYRPDLLLWVPNLIFLAVAVVLFRRVEKA
jgi:lipopolysaccharide export system permease protein